MRKELNALLLSARKPLKAFFIMLNKLKNSERTIVIS